MSDQDYFGIGIVKRGNIGLLDGMWYADLRSTRLGIHVSIKKTRPFSENGFSSLSTKMGFGEFF
jgi:hypothetical protein